MPASSAILAINSALFIVHVLAATNLEAFSIRQNFLPAAPPAGLLSEIRPDKDFGDSDGVRRFPFQTAWRLKPLPVLRFSSLALKVRSVGAFRRVGGRDASPRKIIHKG